MTSYFNKIEAKKLMVEKKADLVVIGGGPAGYVAAITAAQRQMQVIMVELGDFVKAAGQPFPVAGKTNI